MIPGVNWGLRHTSYLQLISFVVPDDLVSHFVTVILYPLIKEKHSLSMVSGSVYLSERKRELAKSLTSNLVNVLISVGTFHSGNDVCVQYVGLCN